MGNCLVTKLNGVVDNDNLLKLGEIRFNFRSINGYCNFWCPEVAEIKAIGNGLFTYVDVNGNRTEHLSSYTHSGNWGNIIPENADTAISMISKYNILQFILNTGGGVNINDFVSTNLTKLELVNCRITEGIIIDTIVKNIPNLTTISLVNTPNVSGDIANFAPLINLTTMVVGTDNQIYGDLLNFATRQIVAGRTSASIGSAWNGNLKFNGENIPNNNNNTLSWEQSESNYVVTMNAGPNFVRTVTVDPNGNIVQ